jgi:hypothetical protein
VLQGGHTACIPVERLEKLIDNRPAPSLCYPADAYTLLQGNAIGRQFAVAHFRRMLGPTMRS